MRPFNIERCFLSPATVGLRLRAAGKDLFEAAVGRSAGGETELSGVDSQIVLGGWIIEGIHDSNDLGATGRRQAIYGANAGGRFPGRATKASSRLALVTNQVVRVGADTPVLGTFHGAVGNCNRAMLR